MRHRADAWLGDVRQQEGGEPRLGDPRASKLHADLVGHFEEKRSSARIPSAIG
jgi:hypothetical protein